MMQIEVEKGGHATLVELSGDRGTVQSPMASAPGSRFALKIQGRTLRLKVHRCVRTGEFFTISGRFIDLTRDLREHLTAGLGSTDA